MVWPAIRPRQLLPIPPPAATTHTSTSTTSSLKSPTPTSASTFTSTSTFAFNPASTSPFTPASTSPFTPASTSAFIPASTSAFTPTSTSPSSTSFSSSNIETGTEASDLETLTTDSGITSSSTTTASGTSLPAAKPSFAWSTFSATAETCTTTTFGWDYSGPQQTIQFFLLLITSPSAGAAIRKHANNNTTIATGVDASALQWTWPQVNAFAGQYVVLALGDGIDVASPLLVINNGTDTSCLVTPAASDTPVSTISGRRAPNGTVIAGGIVGGVVGLLIAIGGFLVWRRSSRRQQLWSGTDSSRSGHVFASFFTTWLPRLLGNGGHGPLLDVAPHPPLMSESNRWPPSESLVSVPRTPAPPYIPRRQTNSWEGESLENVSITGSSFTTPSDVTAMSMLMPMSPSIYLPSYATSISTPPSYTTEADHGESGSPSPRHSYASSS